VLNPQVGTTYVIDKSSDRDGVGHRFGRPRFKSVTLTFDLSPESDAVGYSDNAGYFFRKSKFLQLSLLDPRTRCGRTLDNSLDGRPNNKLVQSMLTLFISWCASLYVLVKYACWV